MAPQTPASETAGPASTTTDPRVLMTSEFLVITALVASLLDDLAEAPTDWSAKDARFDTLQRLATVREQLLRGVALHATIVAEIANERTAAGRPVGFSSRRS